MKVKDYLDVEAIEDVPGVLRRVVVGADDGAPRFVMRVLELQSGNSTPFHSHPWEHEIFVLSGDGIAKGKASEKPIKPGTVVFVEPNEEHCFTNAGKDTLRIICVIPLLDMVAP